MRPSLNAALDVLRINAATPSEHDLLETVEYVTVEHASAAECPRADGSWGRCEECGLPWPCPAWVTTEAAVTEWLIQRSSLTVRAIREHLKGEDAKDRRKPA
jgi:hypothetical protein